MKKFLKRFKGISSQLATLCLLPTTTFAASLESVLNNAASYLQGGLARASGVIVIVGLGYFCLYKQQFPKSYLIWTCVGLGFIFGASGIYALLAS